MRTSSTRLRMGAAVAVTTLGLFSLGGSAFAGENGGQGAEHRNGGGGAAKTSDPDGGGTSPSEAKAEQFQSDKAAYEAPESRHPSGKDRLDEPGGSGIQGQSTSDPDGDTNGGLDKPGGDGGIYTGDQDGNNGCGNDQDFEDDNNGWCGRKPKKVTATSSGVAGASEVKCPEEQRMPKQGTKGHDCEVAGVKVASGDLGNGATLTGDRVAAGAVLGTELQNASIGAGDLIETEVLGVSIERGAAAETSATGGPGTSVLGATFARGAALARTGFGTMAMAVFGILLLLVGLLLTRTPKGEHFV